MSSFAPPVSPLYPTEGIGQGVISDISQRQSSRTTSIHILDDDSLLHIFYLYRPAVSMIDEDENLRFRVTWQRRWDHKHWWHKPAHVCRRWRNLILGSASFLGLYLVCTLGTPVADILANSPPLPLVIDYIDGSHHYDLDGRPNGPGITAEDKEGFFSLSSNLIVSVISVLGCLFSICKSSSWPSTTNYQFWNTWLCLG
ncbi:hypothetical protein BGY98DRAFT_199543 [Russula aff. rugulosa BPL654]|nr:hypothetical protein BGY98DRAFT_199543 [Russula aff. rugulosa BPL654]